MSNKDAKSLDDVTEQVINESNPQGEAVTALIESKPRETGEASDIELKTDLNGLDEVNLHTTLDILGNILEMPIAKFNSSCIISDIIHRRERKLLSLNRKSRAEIVNVARNPDMNMMQSEQNESFIKRFFTGRRNTPPSNNY
jgi:hypothetical protein